MGKVFSVVTRPIRNFNIESRAHKVISQSKPTIAPSYAANVKEAEKLLKENPESLSELLKKDSTLDTHLKDVFVKSHDPIPNDTDAMNIESNRPLPSNRRIVHQPEFGFNEPPSVLHGRCTLRQILKLLSNHQADPKAWDIAKTAETYNLSEETIKNIVHYFRVYQVFIPDKDNKVVYAGPKIVEKPQIESSNK